MIQDSKATEAGLREQVREALFGYGRDLIVSGGDIEDHADDILVLIKSSNQAAYDEGKRDGRSTASWRKETERLVKESNLALLERVEQELDFAKDEDYQLGDHYPMARNGLRYKQRQKLISLRKEYEDE